MEIHKRRPFHDEDAMAAMNDIMFFLMLFFLIIATLSNANVIRIQLPKSDTTEQMAKQPLTLTVTEDMRYYVNATEVPLHRLEGALREAVRRNEDSTVVLRIAKTLTVQDLIDVMAIAAKLKLKMVLSAEKTG
jgi:biopolymer transport protein ExbD